MRWGKILRNALVTVALVTLSIAGGRAFFHFTLHNVYHNDKIIAGMQLLHRVAPATVHVSPPAPRSLKDQPGSRLDLIRSQGSLRVGYFPDSLPFTYFNTEGQLVGFNVEMAYALARDLDVALEFVPMNRIIMAEQLYAGYCDIVMAPVAVTPERAQTMTFSSSYLDQTLAFIVKDHRRNEFSSRDAIRHLKSPHIGVPNTPYYIEKVRQYLPQATLVVLGSVREFFEHRGEELDALVFSAESGSAWTLLYPAYTVAIPKPDVLAVPLAYPLPRGDQELANFINTWIELKKKDKTIATLYDHWILGKNAVPKQPRWSVLRNILGIGLDDDTNLGERGDPWI